MEREKLKELVAQLTLEEKASLCAGRDFWHTRAVERLGIPSSMVTDGPHGLRKQAEGGDHLGIGGSETAVAFPTGSALAAGFDPALAQRLGSELGKLAQAENVSVVLGPAMNIKRSPFCGRNFEYYSEDPLLSTRIGTGTVQGVQSQQVGTSVKHFLANNQEHYRMTSNSVIDERTLREIYLASFEGVIKDAQPWTVMCSYNKINGTYACENKQVLTGILRDEWNFEGYVMTDWGACDDPVDSVKAGLDLIMPGPATGAVEQLVKAVQEDRLEEAVLDQAVTRLLNIVLRYAEHHDPNAEYDFTAGHETARQIVAECAVLLKNEDALLPLVEEEKVLVVGPYATAPRYQGGGSSHIHPYAVTNAWEQLSKHANIQYLPGFGELENDETQLAQAIEAARAADKLVIFAGLPEPMESEGFDRTTLELPPSQNEAISALAAAQPNTAVVLHNGSPVTMPWLDDVKAVLEVYLGGEAVGEATADLLYGKANPSGRLAETFPLRIEDTPAYPYYGVERDDVVYREGVLVGYRWYETMHRPVLFPFGHGLSYTTFEYSGLKVNKSEVLDTDTVEVQVTVTNTGSCPGKEVVQLYVAPPKGQVVRPARELRGFTKIELAPGENKTVAFVLDQRAFALWNTAQHTWEAPSGEYQIQICRSAAEVALQTAVHVHSTLAARPRFDLNTPMGDILAHPVGAAVLTQAMGQMMGSGMQAMSEGDDVMSAQAKAAMMAAMPLRATAMFSDSVRTESLQQLIDAVNAAIEHS